MSDLNMNWGIIDALFQLIKERKASDASTSYTAKLFHQGTEKIAQKVGEEATEIVIEAVKRDKEGVATESADLLYHLLVLWADQDVSPQDILEILAKRQGISGIDEKNSRQN